MTERTAMLGDENWLTEDRQLDEAQSWAQPSPFYSPNMSFSADGLGLNVNSRAERVALPG